MNFRECIDLSAVLREIGAVSTALSRDSGIQLLMKCSPLSEKPLLKKITWSFQALMIYLKFREEFFLKIFFGCNSILWSDSAVFKLSAQETGFTDASTIPY